MKSRHLLFSLLSLMIIVTLKGGHLPVAAQRTDEWAPSNPIPFYPDLYPPYLVADSDHTVHAFNDQSTGGVTKAIFYRQWTLEMGWTPPVDIIIPITDVSKPLQGAFLDQSGRFHLIFYGGSHERGDIFYTRAWAAEASQTQAWDDPITAGEAALPLPDATLTGDGMGNLMIVYSGEKDGLGVYEVHSTDSGDTWSQPTQVSLVYEEEVFPAHIQPAIDQEGTLHIVWSVVNERAFGEEVYYARRETDGQWSDPYLLAAREGSDYAADWASIIEFNDELIVMYMDGSLPDGVPPTRWMRRSRDGGRTWSSPVRPFPHVGENGFAVFLVDSNEILHVLLANRVGNPAVGGMWHGVWLGDTWSELEMITAETPQEAISSGAYVDGASASRPNAIILQGNVILSTWWHDIRGESPPAAYSYIILDAPELPNVPLPAPMSTPILNSEPSQAVQLSTPTSTPDIGLAGREEDVSVISYQHPSTSLVWGVSTAVLLIAAVIAFQYYYHRIR